MHHPPFHDATIHPPRTMKFLRIVLPLFILALSSVVHANRIVGACTTSSHSSVSPSLPPCFYALFHIKYPYPTVYKPEAIPIYSKPPRRPSSPLTHPQNIFVDTRKVPQMLPASTNATCYEQLLKPQHLTCESATLIGSKKKTTVFACEIQIDCDATPTTLTKEYATAMLALLELCCIDKGSGKIAGWAEDLVKGYRVSLG